MFRWGCGVGLLMAGGEGGQFLGQTGGIGLLLGRIAVRRGVGRIRVGRIRTRREIVFLRPDLFVVIRRILLLGLRIGLL